MPSGLGYGAAVGLEQVLARQFKQALEQQRMREQQQAFQLQQDRMAQDQQQFDTTQDFRERSAAADAALAGTNLAMRTREADADRQRLETVEIPLRTSEIMAGRAEQDADRGSRERIAQLGLTGRLLSAGQPSDNAAAPTQPQGPSRLAEAAARNPDILQGMTPTDRGAIMREISENTDLMQGFEGARSAPVIDRAQRVMGALDQLLSTDALGKSSLTGGAKSVFGSMTFPGTRGIQGALAAAFPGGTTPGQATDAAAAVRQVIGQGVVDLIADMKSQSATGATGFGQLSEKELDVLMSAATQLTNRITEDTALRELLAIRDGMQKILSNAPTADANDSAADADPLGILGP